MAVFHTATSTPLPAFCGGCDAILLQRSLDELETLYAPPKLAASALSARRCPRPSWPFNFSAQTHVQTSAKEPRCLVARLVDLVLCSQARVLRRELVEGMQLLVTANTVLPEAAPCMHALGSRFRASEFFDNYKRMLIKLGDKLRDGDKEAIFFENSPSETVWRKRVRSKANELSSELLWRPRSDSDGFGDSESGDFERPRRSSGSSSSPLSDHMEDMCGMSQQGIVGVGDMEPLEVAGLDSLREASRARPLSSSGCVWMLDHACIEGRKLVLFAKDRDEVERLKLPRKLLGCGEFGHFDFNAISIRHPRARRRLLVESNSTESKTTLVIVPGLLSGISPHNPFHLLHSAVPVAWQLHHPSYGLCVRRESIEIRLAFLSAYHAKRQEHFWKVFAREYGQELDAKSLKQVFSIASAWRFWWGPFAERPPAPLGADENPRCFRRVVFGRELMRTGIGGFVTPRVVDFYRRYIEAAMNQGIHHTPVGVVTEITSRSQGAPDDSVEWRFFYHMRPGQGEGDPANLRDFVTPPFSNSHFASTSAALQLTLLPLRGYVNGAGANDSVIARYFNGVSPEGRSRFVHVLVIQRRPGTGRWVANLDEAIGWVVNNTFLGAKLQVIVADFERLHPAAQWQLARQAHILIAVSGAALAWTAFMPSGAVVLDIFPPSSNFCIEGWGRNPVSHYGGLARLSGVQHACMEHPAELQDPDARIRALSSEAQRKHEERREVRELLGGFWHGQDVRLDMTLFQTFFHEAVTRVLSGPAKDMSF